MYADLHHATITGAAASFGPELSGDIPAFEVYLPLRPAGPSRPDGAAGGSCRRTQPAQPPTPDHLLPHRRARRREHLPPPPETRSNSSSRYADTHPSLRRTADRPG
ncbi:hypothetical protein ACU686_03610 [Yinghuangia aomiensis]